MSIRDELGRQMRKALKVGAADRLRALRMLRAELQVAETSAEEFLPTQMERDELQKIIAAIIEENHWGPRDLGRVMKIVMGRHGDMVDGRTAQEIARARLAGRP